jgi:site-specific DNA-methyltransferase (adenine-specific)
VVELNNIYNESCVDFIKSLNAENIRIDVIVTSPPYNINKEYSSYKDNKEREEYLNWLYQIAKLSYLILKDNGSFFLNIGGTHSDPMLPFDVVKKFKEAGYKLQNTIHWIKSISIEKESSVNQLYIPYDMNIYMNIFLSHNVDGLSVAISPNVARLEFKSQNEEGIKTICCYD